MKTIHMCIDVRGAIHRGHFEGMIDSRTGRQLTDREAMDALLDLVAQGVKVVPLGEPCEGFSYETGCPGHDDKETKR